MTQVAGRVPRLQPRLQTLLLALLLAACGPAPSASPSPEAVATTPGASPTPTATVAPTPTATPLPAEDLVAADLDGLLVAPELAHRLPLAVSIDDARVARPQSGFNAASVVWQAPADGYETRYLLIFQEQDAADIGPVRSARLYLAQWAAELRAALAHYGGDRISRDWMAANRGDLFTDIDGLGSGNPAYHRISSREAPHNAYTSTEDLWRMAARLGGAEAIDPAIHPWTFREDVAATDRGSEAVVEVPYKTARVGYAYRSATNDYARSLDGTPHVDPLDGRPVSARTIIVLFMPFRTDSTIEPGHNRPVLGFVGTGDALVISEGRSVAARWSKAGESEPTRILDIDGHDLALVRGRIFIQVVPLGTKVVVR